MPIVAQKRPEVFRSEEHLLTQTRREGWQGAVTGTEILYQWAADGTPVCINRPEAVRLVPELLGGTGSDRQILEVNPDSGVPEFGELNMEFEFETDLLAYLPERTGARATALDTSRKWNWNGTDWIIAPNQGTEIVRDSTTFDGAGSTVTDYDIGSAFGIWIDSSGGTGDNILKSIAASAGAPGRVIFIVNSLSPTSTLQIGDSGGNIVGQFAQLAYLDAIWLVYDDGLAKWAQIYARPSSTNINMLANSDNNVTFVKHGFAPQSPSDATTFLNGAATPDYEQVKDSDLETTDVTSNDVSTSKHGFAPKAPNDTTKFLRGDAAYAAVSRLPINLSLEGVISPAQLVANTDNWNPTGLATANVIRVSTDASRNLTGIVAPAVDGTLILLINVGTNNLVLVHDATSTAANRFFCAGAGNQTVNEGDAVWLWYDGTTDRWRPIST